MKLFNNLVDGSDEVLHEFIEMSKKLDSNLLTFVDKNKQDKLEKDFEEKVKVREPEFDEDGFQIVKK